MIKNIDSERKFLLMAEEAPVLKKLNFKDQGQPVLVINAPQAYELKRRLKVKCTIRPYWRRMILFRYLEQVIRSFNYLLKMPLLISTRMVYYGSVTQRSLRRFIKALIAA